MAEIIENKRTFKNHAEEGLFCFCGAPVTMSCTDAKQVGDEWIESQPRYGCDTHPVEPMIHFADGTSMTAKEYEKLNENVQ